MNDPVFYCVWAPNRGAPTIKHQFRGDAVREAERLSRTSPGTEFFVLMSTDRLVKDDVKHTVMFRDDDGAIPF